MTTRRAASIAMALPLSLALSLLGACASSSRAGAEEADPAEAIAIALERDEALAATRNQRTHEVSLAVASREYAAALDAMDMSGAPLAFREAFAAHAQAWRDFAEAVDQCPAASRLRGEFHAAIEALRDSGALCAREVELALDQVWESWAPIERLARRAGVET